MWFCNYEEIWNDGDRGIFFARHIRINKIPRRNFQGKNTGEIARYEVEEFWTSLEQETAKTRDYVVRNDKRATVLSFETQEEVETLFRLLTWVLNAPPEIPLDTVLSPQLLSMISIANTERLEKIRLQEAEELARQREEHEREMADLRRQQELRKQRMLLRGTRVYVFEVENGTCKIGFTNNIERRAAAIRGHSGMEIIQMCYTIPLANAPKIEKLCHKHFAEKRRYDTEFFNVTFSEACDYLATLATIRSILAKEGAIL